MIDPTRQAFVDEVLGAVDLRADDQKYVDFIAAGETPGRQSVMKQMSGCALTVAAIWRRVGVDAPELAVPYKDGTAISRLCAIARHAGAWLPWTGDLMPNPGDMVLIGDNSATGGFEHVYTVTAWFDGSLKIFETIDGGQVDVVRGVKYQCIKAKRHKWNGQRDGGRIIIGVVDCTKLPFKPDEAA